MQIDVVAGRQEMLIEGKGIGNCYFSPGGTQLAYFRAAEPDAVRADNREGNVSLWIKDLLSGESVQAYQWYSGDLTSQGNTPRDMYPVWRNDDELIAICNPRHGSNAEKSRALAIYSISEKGNKMEQIYPEGHSWGQPRGGK
jgi:Tol biopolymer transport system component